MPTLREHNQNSIYIHPSSRALRAAPTPPNPITTARARHRGEVAEMGRRHNAEHDGLADQQRKMRLGGGSFPDRRGDHDPDVLAEAEARRKLTAQHKTESETLSRKHSKEIATLLQHHAAK